ncbi:MAG TPA: hypothetical protein VHE34_16310 [Puia sp.]|uniref:hypothetical protein n=1 Tax=Puia sp. TaxID=2045100 RepID=UPI000925C1CC|nr:hypothetical protein [Puia sp.]MBN8852669.1 hypothetical protein [Sphingobacteriales bacterium]OJW55492.1 MAG: hypothetical protein BGO55_02830 [Sphingobacteriales bacterium 50-39]HVU96794.1 hypothetical protein [Puia sp.]
MPSLPYKTLADHETLLAEKGWLNPEMGGTRVGDWLKEFREKFEECRIDALTTGRRKEFTLPATGIFNDGLDKVAFTLRYRYDPRVEALALITIQTKLGRTPWTYFLNGRREPPTPTEAYEKLLGREGPLRNEIVLNRVQREHDQLNDPFRDPHLDMNHPDFQQTNDLHKDEEFREYPPNDLTTFFNRPSRHH